jgi:hypothetical protein
MFRPSKEMIIRDLQQALWEIMEPYIASQDLITDEHVNIMRLAINRLVEERAHLLTMVELADLLDSLEQTAADLLEHLLAEGVAGDPVRPLCR